MCYLYAPYQLFVPQRKILTDPGPIKLHERQELLSLNRVVGIVSHTKQRRLSLYETLPELLPVGSRRPAAVQHSHRSEARHVSEESTYDRQKANLRTKCPM